MASLTKKGDWYSLTFHDAARTPCRKKLALHTRTKREALALQRIFEDGYAARRFDPWIHDPRRYLNQQAEPKAPPDRDPVARTSS